MVFSDMVGTPPWQEASSLPDPALELSQGIFFLRDVGREVGKVLLVEKKLSPVGCFEAIVSRQIPPVRHLGLLTPHTLTRV
ncbi:hypothetical protein XA68_10456 [Ophiocordyceps unilateralis]|uniref:Uncharacterized protein n=1 Tax=Ophiocordyceps unilateralis TaxID=268505 RepID=A0A2A9PHD0_OPHUN|nr:hypothetical protein XA68_10456 [Ophiocordyceps unilateralis]